MKWFTHTTRAYLELHFAVFLYGFTAILGDLISISAISLVWWRVLLASTSFWLLIRSFQKIKNLGKKYIKNYIIIGGIIALHWVCFYGAIKLSNASIALITFGTTSLFTSLIEPLLITKKLKPTELLVGLFIIPGVYLITDSTAIELRIGIWVGLFSAFLAALFSTLNKKHIQKGKELEISCVELSASWVWMCLALPFYFLIEGDVLFIPTPYDWMYLLILSIVCTTIAFMLSLRPLNYISAFSSNLIFNLEPVYGILLAAVILGEHEQLNLQFYIGVVIILLGVFLFPILNKKKSI